MSVQITNTKMSALISQQMVSTLKKQKYIILHFRLLHCNELTMIKKHFKCYSIVG